MSWGQSLGHVQTGQAGAQALAPVRELRGALLAPQHRVRGPGGAGAELRRGDPADARREPGLLEDRLREVGPRAVATSRDVVDAIRQADDLLGGLREMADVGRRSALIVDDR